MNIKKTLLYLLYTNRATKNSSFKFIPTQFSVSFHHLSQVFPVNNTQEDILHVVYIGTLSVNIFLTKKKKSKSHLWLATYRSSEFFYFLTWNQLHVAPSIDNASEWPEAITTIFVLDNIYLVNIVEHLFDMFSFLDSSLSINGTNLSFISRPSFPLNNRDCCLTLLLISKVV